MRYGLIGSIALHILVFGVVIFNFATADKKSDIAAPQPAVSVEIMTPGELSQRQAGKQDADAAKPPQAADIKAPDAVATAKKEVEPVAVPKPAERDALPPPPPAPKLADAQPAKPVEPIQVEPAKVEKAQDKPKSPPKREAVRKAPSRPKPDESKKADAPKRVEEQPKQADAKSFDPNRIASLLEKDAAPSSKPAAARPAMDIPPSKTTSDRQTAVLNRDPNAGQTGGVYEPKQPWRPASSLQDQAQGLPQARGPANSSTDADILFAQISRQWDLPVGGASADGMVIKLHFTLTPEGMLDGEPVILNPSRDPAFMAAADAAKRAVYRAQPFHFPSGRYTEFRDNTISFDPSEMYGAARG